MLLLWNGKAWDMGKPEYEMIIWSSLALIKRKKILTRQDEGELDGMER